MKGHDNALLVLINKNLNKTQSKSSSIAATTYRTDCLITGQFLEIKDMFYQVLQCLAHVLGPCIMTQKRLNEPLFDVFYEFLEKEYFVLLQKRGRAATPMDDG